MKKCSFLQLIENLSKKVLKKAIIQSSLESWPSKQILKVPIRDAVLFRHILEHVPSGRPGVVISYNFWWDKESAVGGIGISK